MPVNLVHVPPVCSPVMIVNKSIAVVLLSQILMLPSVPASTCGAIFIVAILVSFGQPAKLTIYLNVLVVAPAAGVKVLPLNVPPVPVKRVHVPPVSSPVMIENKLIAVVLLSQILMLPSVPAVGDEVTVTVATLVSFGHGDVPVIIYLNVLVVAVASTVKLLPLNTPPVPVNRVHVPPVCSPVITLNKSITVPEPSHSVTVPSNPAFTCGEIVIVATLVSFEHGAVPVMIYLNVLVVAPTDGVKVLPLNVPPVPVNLVHVPPVSSPVMIENKSIAVVLLSQILILPSVPAITCGAIFIVATLVSFEHGAVPVIIYINVLVVAPTAGV